MRYKIKLILVGIALSCVFSVVLLPSYGLASNHVSHTCIIQQNGKPVETTVEASSQEVADRICASRQQAATSGPGGNFSGKCEFQPLTRDNCNIVKYILTIIDVISGLVGIVVVIMIAIAGIQYSAARDNPQASVAAKNKIRDALLALVGYLFIYAFLQYIVPGGVL